MKDNFSKVSEQYAQFRPLYPGEIFDYLSTIVAKHDVAWDCATGNGQVARGLAPHFKNVLATDISEQQISHAYRADNIHYSVSSAEQTAFPENYFDLITVGQAIHWFDFSAFYSEVNRTAKHQALLVVLGYDLIRVDSETDKLTHHFYEKVLKGFWDPVRKYVDERYQTIPFPFKEIHPPQFELRLEWTVEHFLGYLGTWSAVQHYKDHHQRDPVGEVKNDLLKAWNSGQMKTVTFPIVLRIGVIQKQQ